MEKYCILKKEHFQSLYSFSTGRHTPYEIGIPLVDLSDKTIEEIYYFRFHTYCKHIKDTKNGYVVTEFLPKVLWAGKHNTICCPAGHHFYEGRWFHNSDFLKDYAEFWFSPNGKPRKYSFWAADSIYAAACVSGDFSTAEKLYERLKENYFAWEREKSSLYGMFYQIDDRDGMEYSAGGSGLRPTINSYMYGDAIALAKLAKRLKKDKDVILWNEKASELKIKINTLLWDKNAQFYKTRNVDIDEMVTVREQIGYVPWYFNIPDAEMSDAWKFLFDEKYFYAPYGPTTAERNSPEFLKKFKHECLWNGPSWPFATSQTLTALGNLLRNYNQSVMTKSHYYKLLHLYASCHYLTENGKTVPFIDENLDPFTGEWLTRKILKKSFKPFSPKERGKDYNHSTFCDLVLGGLAGICSNDDNRITINPLFINRDLEYFCADGILYHGQFITVLWDKTGERYGKGKGYLIFIDGEKVFSADNVCKFEM